MIQSCVILLDFLTFFLATTFLLIFFYIHMIRFGLFLDLVLVNFTLNVTPLNWFSYLVVSICFSLVWPFRQIVSKFSMLHLRIEQRFFSHSNRVKSNELIFATEIKKSNRIRTNRLFRWISWLAVEILYSWLAWFNQIYRFNLPSLFCCGILICFMIHTFCLSLPITSY